MRTLKGKVVVITGAASGIGQALAVDCALRGADIAMCDVDRIGLSRTARLVLEQGRRVLARTLDVSNRDAVAAFANAVEESLGPADAVINNAGVSLSAREAAMSGADAEWVMNVNFWGVLHVCRAFLPQLLLRPDAHIVNVSSVFGLIGVATQAAYCASKAAVRGYTEAIRQELAATPVRVTCVFPGGVRTNIVRNGRHRLDPSAGNGMDDEARAALFDEVARTSAAACAAAIITGMLKNRSRVVIGQDARFIDLVARLAPHAASDVFRWLGAKLVQRRLRRASAATVVAAALAAAPLGAPSRSARADEVAPVPAIVATTTGRIAGVVEGASAAFKGIPFATPPVGPLRWRAPRPMAPWLGVRDATSYGSPCLQPALKLPPAPKSSAATAVLGSEDCLYLNVWAPAVKAADARLPVMVFLHGGGLIEGSGAKDMLKGVAEISYDGRAIAELGHVVVVTLNYRLGIMGFLATPELAGEDAHGSTGNYGILDQIEALRWVHANAQAFGGDAANVTIFGESAGGSSVCTLLASPLARDLFAKAIIESGTCMARPLAEVETQWQSVLAQATRAGRCADSSTACWRRLEGQALTKIQPPMIANAGSPTARPLYSAVVDGYVLPAPVLELIKQGSGRRVPLIVGSNAAEIPPDLVAKSLRDLNEEEYASYFSKWLGPVLGAKILAAYPPAGPFNDVREALAAFATDHEFTCAARAIAGSARRHGDVYRYVLAQDTAAPLTRLANFFTHLSFEPMHPFHGLDLVYVFQNLDGFYRDIGHGLFSPSAEELATQQLILKAWTTFARTGQPGVAWPTVDLHGDGALLLKAQPRYVNDFRRERCEALAGLPR